MNIIYPPLVEQSFHFYRENGEEQFSKSELYRSMVENHIITENGSPTVEAIERGLIQDFYEEQGLSFDEFLTIYPIFEAYDPELFQNIDGFWEMPVSLKQELLAQLKQGQFDYDSKTRLEEYFSER